MSFHMWKVLSCDEGYGLIKEDVLESFLGTIHATRPLHPIGFEQTLQQPSQTPSS